jgi:serine/threonine protein kinase
MFADTNMHFATQATSTTLQRENLLATQKIKLMGDAHIQKVLLGSGRYSRVYRVDMEDGKSYAVKQLKREVGTYGHLDNILNEVMVLLKVSHPSIISLIGKYRDSEHYNIVLQHCNGENLS